MKNQSIYLLLFMFVALTTSCTNEDDTDSTVENLKTVIECEITLEPDTLVSICVDGADYALPNETIKFVSTFYSKNDNPSNTEFLWTIESGSMEILNVENSIDGLIAKSITTIKFNSNYSGNGLINVNAENETGIANADHIVELRSNQ